MEKYVAILAGGNGTRLKQITGSIPKPLVPFNGKPFLIKKLEELKKNFNPDKFLLMIQEHQQEFYIKFIRETNILNYYHVELVIEEEKLGTGGAVKNMFKKTGIVDCIVSNADTIIKGNVEKFGASTENSILACKGTSDGSFGVIDVDENLNVNGFSKRLINGGALLNSGVYHLAKSSFLAFPREVFELESEFFPYLISKRDLKVVQLDFSFVDIGTPETFWQEAQF